MTSNLIPNSFRKSNHVYNSLKSQRISLLYYLNFNQSFVLIFPNQNFNSAPEYLVQNSSKIIQPNLLFHLLYQNSKSIKSVDPHVQSSEAKIIQFNPELGATASNKPGDPLMSSSLPSSWRGLRTWILLVAVRGAEMRGQFLTYAR